MRIERNIIHITQPNEGGAKPNQFLRWTDSDLEERKPIFEEAIANNEVYVNPYCLPTGLTSEVMNASSFGVREAMVMAESYAAEHVGEVATVVNVVVEAHGFVVGAFRAEQETGSKNVKVSKVEKLIDLS